MSSAIRDALKLAAAGAPESRIAVRAEHIRHGAIANNTFPPSAWWFNVDPGAGGTAPDLEDAIWECLCALRLSPSGRSIRRPPFDDARFRFDAPQPMDWASELARCAQEWLGSDIAIDDVHALVAQLRALGHPLYSFDEGDDFAIWTTWGPERPRRQLAIDVRFPAYEAPVVTATVRDGER